MGSGGCNLLTFWVTRLRPTDQSVSPPNCVTVGFHLMAFNVSLSLRISRLPLNSATLKRCNSSRRLKKLIRFESCSFARLRNFNFMAWKSELRRHQSNLAFSVIFYTYLAIPSLTFSALILNSYRIIIILVERRVTSCEWYIESYGTSSMNYVARNFITSLIAVYGARWEFEDSRCNPCTSPWTATAEICLKYVCCAPSRCVKRVYAKTQVGFWFISRLARINLDSSRREKLMSCFAVRERTNHQTEQLFQDVRNSFLNWISGVSNI